MSGFRIGVACTFYNDVRGLERLIPTLDPFDHIIMNDGSWKDFGNGLSDDGSRELIQKHKHIHLLDNPNLMPNQKQTNHLRYAGELGCDVLVLIDADELITQFDRHEIISSLDKCRKPEQNVYWCKFYEYHIDWVMFHYPRVVINPLECSYPDRHNQIWAHGREQIHRKKDLIIDGLAIKHDKSVRTVAREAYNKSWNLEHPRH